MSQIDNENLESNFEKYVSYLDKFGETSIENFVESEGHRLATSPANAQKDEYGCYNGGLVENTLEILDSMRKLDIVAGKKADQKSLWKVALLHNIGAIGTSSEDLFLPQDSDWHIEKLGMLYKRNQNLKSTCAERTFQILFHYSIELTEEEYFAILSIDKDKPLNYLGSLLVASRALFCR